MYTSWLLNNLICEVLAYYNILVAYYRFTPTFMKNSANFTIEAFIPMW